MKKTFELATQAHFLFAAIALVMGLVFIHIIPLSWGVDEHVHLSRAYQLSQGTLREKKLNDSNEYGGRLPIELKQLEDIVGPDLADNYGYEKQQVDDPKAYQDLAKLHLSGTKINQVFTGSGTYFPFAYAAPTVGIIIAKLLHPSLGSIIFAARLATLLLYILLVTGSLYLLRKRTAKWLIFVVALLPMSLFQASIVNVDSYASGLSILLLSQLIHIWVEDKKVTIIQLSFLALTAALLTLSKPNYIFLALAIFLIPTRLMSKSQQIYCRIGMGLVVFIPVILWNLSIQSIVSNGAAAQRPGIHINAHEQLSFIEHNPLGYIGLILKNILNHGWYGQMLGVLGHNFIGLPDYILYLETALLAIVTFFAREKVKIVSGILLVGLSIAGLVSIITILYLVYNAVGSHLIEGVQGRYFVPLLPFILYGICQFIPIKVTISERYSRYFFPLISLGCLIAAASNYAIRTG